MLLATTEGLLLLEKTDQLTNMILQSDLVEDYRVKYFAMKNNSVSQDKIQAFSKMKDQYEEVQRFGKYHPDYKKVMKAVLEVKREMDLDENVHAFKEAETQLQCLLDEISVIIAHSVSKNIKVPTGNPFFESQSNCTSGCGSGGSCGCSS